MTTRRIRHTEGEVTVEAIHSFGPAFGDVGRIQEQFIEHHLLGSELQLEDDPERDSKDVRANHCLCVECVWYAAQIVRQAAFEACHEARKLREQQAKLDAALQATKDLLGSIFPHLAEKIQLADIRVEKLGE